MEEMEKRALDCLPERLREAVARTNCRRIEEIRLRQMRRLSVTSDGQNISCDTLCFREDLAETVEKLSQGSLYSHADEIREGVITSRTGIRAGISGRAVVMSGRVECVRDISSLCIRIPHRIAGVADELFARMGQSGVLIFSPPGCGKTTMLRELIPLLSRTRRTAVIDTRYELCVDDEGDLADVYSGYPRGFGIQSAVRSMSPEVIVCDEIAGEEDVRALKEAYNAGVTVCASVHAGSYNDVCGNTKVRELVESGVFSLICGKNSRTGPWEFIEQNETAVAGECCG